MMIKSDFTHCKYFHFPLRKVPNVSMSASDRPSVKLHLQKKDGTGIRGAAFSGASWPCDTSSHPEKLPCVLNPAFGGDGNSTEKNPETVIHSAL